MVTEEIFSPEEVMPHPKAPPRKQNLRGRKRRHTAILTDSPEMRFMKRKRKEKREKKKKVDRLSQKSKKMKKVYSQDKKVVKEKIQAKRKRRRLTEL